MRFSIISGWPHGGHGGGFSLEKKIEYFHQFSSVFYLTMMGGGVGGQAGICRQTSGGWIGAGACISVQK